MVQDTELYRHLLGIVAPWTVDRVQLDAKECRVDVWATHPPGERWPCPQCGQAFSFFDHAEERAWRHLDSCAFHTFLHARAPSVECPLHGKLQVCVTCAEPNSRFTPLFERWSIQVILLGESCLPYVTLPTVPLLEGSNRTLPGSDAFMWGGRLVGDMARERRTWFLVASIVAVGTMVASGMGWLPSLSSQSNHGTVAPPVRVRPGSENRAPSTSTPGGPYVADTLDLCTNFLFLATHYLETAKG